MNRRNTPSRQMIRDSLQKTAGAMSHNMVEEQLKGKVDRVTIYRALASFCEDGLVHRVVSDDGKAYYALCDGCKGDAHIHEHAHFHCLNCKKVECLPYNTSPQLPAGYSLQSINFWISGECKTCAQGTRP